MIDIGRITKAQQDANKELKHMLHEYSPAEYNLALSKHLRTLRLAHKYTQEAMAKVMYLQSAHSYAHYERGTLMVKAHMLYLIEREFKLDAGSIMNQIVEGIWIR